MEPFLGVEEVGGNASVWCFRNAAGRYVEWKTSILLVGFDEGVVEKPTEVSFESFVS